MARRRGAASATLGSLRLAASGLLRDGAFRVELPQPKHFGRAYKPRYSDAVHLVARVEGAQVVGSRGQVLRDSARPARARRHKGPYC